MLLRLATCAIIAGLLAPDLSAAAGPFDGAYQGTVKLVRSSLRASAGSGGCGGNAEGTPSTRRIVDGRLKMPWGTSEYEVPVGADGTISGNAMVGTAQITVTGKVMGNSLAVDYSSQSCGYRYEATRR